MDPNIVANWCLKPKKYTPLVVVVTKPIELKK